MPAIAGLGVATGTLSGFFGIGGGFLIVPALMLATGMPIMKAFGAIVPPDADAASVADAIVGVVDAPFGKRPFRVHIDPTQDGAEVAFAVIDRVRNEMLHRVGFSDLLHPRANG